MPVNRAVFIQLSLLLLIVPLQYVITQWKPVSHSERSHNLNRLLVKLGSWKNKLLSARSWRQWYDSVYQYVSGMFQRSSTVKKPFASSTVSDDDLDVGESPAVEVLEFKDKSGHFAGSTTPRSPRPPHVKYRIGQVIRHKSLGYRGVIIGWDETAKAPEDWIKRMHGSRKRSVLRQPFYAILTDARDQEPSLVYIPQRDCELLSIPTQHWRQLPSYSVLVDSKDRPELQTTYVVEENIEIIRNTKIAHPDVDAFFEQFDGTRYLARPWLKVIYPHDQ